MSGAARAEAHTPVTLVLRVPPRLAAVAEDSLLSIAAQSQAPDRVLIAPDGLGDETARGLAELARGFRPLLPDTAVQFVHDARFERTVERLAAEEGVAGVLRSGDALFGHWCQTVRLALAQRPGARLVRMRELGYACELYETSAFADGEDDPRLGGMRSAAEESLGGMMRHLMVAEPDRAGEPRPDAVADLVRRTARIGRAPLVYVHRGLSGQRLHSLLALGDRGAPAIAVLVGRQEPEARIRHAFARAGWAVVVMTTDSGDPWRNIRRFEDAARAGGVRA